MLIYNETVHTNYKFNIRSTSKDLLPYDMKNDIDALKSGPNGTVKPPSSFRLIFIPLSLSNLSKQATKFLKFLISAGHAERFSHSPTDPIIIFNLSIF